MAESGRNVPILCYWDGQIKNGAEGIDYEGPSPRVIRASNEIKMNELIEMIYGVTGWDKQSFDIEIVGRYLAGTTPTRCFICLPIVDDASLASMFDAIQSLQSGWNCIQLYLTKKALVTTDYIRVDVSHCGQSGACTPSLSADDSHGLINRSRDLACMLQVSGSSGDDADKEAVDGSDVMIESQIKRVNDDGVRVAVLSENAVEKQQGAIQTEVGLYVGQKFGTKDELKVAVKLYFMKIRRQYRVKDTSPTLYVLKCMQGQTCPWHLRAIRLVQNENSYFEIIRLRGPHTCAEPIADKDQVQLDSNFIAYEMKDFIRAGMSIKAIQKVIASRYNHKISYCVAWAARNKALEKKRSSQPLTVKAGPGRPKKKQPLSVDEAGQSQPLIVNRRPGRKKKTAALCYDVVRSAEPSLHFVKAEQGLPNEKQQSSDDAGSSQK